MSIIEDMLPPGVPEKDKAAGLLKDRGDGVLDRVAESGGGGVKYVECHADVQLQNIQCELSAEQVIDLVKNGENVKIRLFTSSNFLNYVLTLNGETNAPSPISSSVSFSTHIVADMDNNVLYMNYSIEFKDNGSIIGLVTVGTLNPFTP